jgi:hypothetical protein
MKYMNIEKLRDTIFPRRKPLTGKATSDFKSIDRQTDLARWKSKNIVCGTEETLIIVLGEPAILLNFGETR